MKHQLLADPFTDKQDEKIAEFFREHMCYYDMADLDYKNKKK